MSFKTALTQGGERVIYLIKLFRKKNASRDPYTSERACSTLLHEIGHIILHIRTDKFKAIFDEFDSADVSEVEREADDFAQEALIPQEKWKRCVSRFTRSEAAVRLDAAKLEVHPSIVAGRIRREANDYTILSGLVGAGSVRTQFH